MTHGLWIYDYDYDSIYTDHWYFNLCFKIQHSLDVTWAQWLQRWHLAQDAPKDSPEPVLVQPSKTGASICSPCFYVQRGSFPGSSQLQLQTAMKDHPSIKKKQLSWEVHARICVVQLKLRLRLMFCNSKLQLWFMIIDKLIYNLYQDHN